LQVTGKSKKNVLHILKYVCTCVIYGEGVRGLYLQEEVSNELSLLVGYRNNLGLSGILLSILPKAYW
jgi:hypothetical protein